MYASRRRNRTDHVSARAGARCDSSRAVLGPVSSGLLISILICRVRSFAFMVFLRIHDFILDDWSFFIFGNLLSPSRAVVLVEELLTAVGFPANRCTDPCGACRTFMMRMSPTWTGSIPWVCNALFDLCGAQVLHGENSWSRS